jgi:two-component system chemotaxis response regulator CheB
MRTKPVRVLVVDDSALVRKVLSQLLGSDPGIEVVGTANDPLQARDLIKQLNPDVLTLDVEMPRMDGVTFLANLMRLRPMPVVMVSSLTQKGADVTFQALEIGAVDFVTKPKVDLSHQLEDYAEEIVAKVKHAARTRVRVYNPDAVGTARPRAPVAATRLDLTHKLIAIGASTGGTEAIREVLEHMASDSPAIVITQHIPEAFSAPFAARMDKSSPMRVCQAEDGQPILQGHAYIAPGNRHLVVERSGARYRCKLLDTAPVNRHRPSVDVLFDSVAENLGANAVGVLLTGMGADGAKGLLRMKEAGARTICQDEQSSVVWGMPGEAVKLGAADHVVALDKVSELASRLIRG